MVNFGPPESIPPQFAGRRFHRHNPRATLMRTTPAENRRLGEIFAAKLNAARGPVTVMLPLAGFSAIDRAGEPFYDPEADTAFAEALTAQLAPQVRVIRFDGHINDEAFAHTAADTLHAMIGAAGRGGTE